MPIEDYIRTTLNLVPERIESVETVHKDQKMEVFLILKDTHPVCPFCGGPAKSKGLLSKSFRTLETAGIPTVVHWKRRRYICKDCARTFSEDNIFTPENMSSSFSLLNNVVMDLRNLHLTYKDIAARYQLSPTRIEVYADSFLSIPRLRLPENLGIDELHSSMAKYGSAYLCVIVDNTDRNLTEVLPSRSKHELSKYMEKIPQSERDGVKYATMDMWEPYRDVMKKYCRNCICCVDGFHVVKDLSDRFTRMRCDIMEQMPHGSAAYYLLKHWHRLLETDVNLDNTPQYNNFFKTKINYRDIYDMLLRINESLSLAYQLKEMYRDFNKTARPEECEKKFDQVMDAFKYADISYYRSFISMAEYWKPEILNSFRRPSNDRKESNALAEYMNGRLGDFIRISNGISNFERFRARSIFALNKRMAYTITDHLVTNKREGKKRGRYSNQKFI